MLTTDLRPDVAVIGGSGFYTFLSDPTEVRVETPYGDPSAPISVGTVGDKVVAFLPRHGAGHQFPAHKVPYRANLWALRSLGVRQILAPCAVGGLREELGPGTFVVPDQLVDRTTTRIQTYYDQGACHVSFADPYCPRLRHDLLAGLAEQQPVDGGAMVVIEGPRFSTRAESRWYADQGWAVVNMTGHPEAVLARELALCYATVALVTDHDAGVDTDSAVTMEAVFEVFAAHTETLKAALTDVVAGLGSRLSSGPGGPPRLDRRTEPSVVEPGEERARVETCACADALAGIDLPFELP